MQRWQFWAGLVLKFLGCIILGLALGWQLMTVFDPRGWLHIEDVGGVKSGVAGWKWSQVRSLAAFSMERHSDNS